MYKNNKSGFSGVCYDVKSKKWRAYATFNNHKYRFGSFQTKEEAISAHQRELPILKAKLQEEKIQNQAKFFFLAFKYYVDKAAPNLTFKSFLHSDFPAPSPLPNFLECWSGEDREIMDAWSKGFSIFKLAKLYNFSNSGLTKKIIKNLTKIKAFF